MAQSAEVPFVPRSKDGAPVGIRRSSGPRHAEPIRSAFRCRLRLNLWFSTGQRMRLCFSTSRDGQKELLENAPRTTRSQRLRRALANSLICFGAAFGPPHRRASLVACFCSSSGMPPDGSKGLKVFASVSE